MAWVNRIREVHVVMPSFLAKHKPAPRRRTCREVPLAEARMPEPVMLPESRGTVGPCGTTMVGLEPSAFAWTWTLLTLVEIQCAWNHPATPPFLASSWSPKDGPRGRQAA